MIAESAISLSMKAIHSGLKGEIPEKKMSPTIHQWILPPKYIMILKSFDPKSESGIFLN